MGNEVSSSTSSSTTASTLPLRSTLHGLSTGNDVGKLLGHNARNKRILITGASSGLGFETARVLANCGATVIIATLPRFTTTALQELRSLVPNGTFESIDIDLSNLTNIREVATTYIESGKELHILINNAGIMSCPLSSSAEGYELQFAINYLGHFLLTELLLPVLIRTAEATATAKVGGGGEVSINNSNNNSNNHNSNNIVIPSRIINLSSAAHCLLTPMDQGIYWDRLPLNAVTELKNVYDPWECYGISKLCLANYASYLQYRSDNAKLPLIACSVHPGAILTTGLKQYVGLQTFFGMVSKPSLWGFTVFSPSLSKKSPITKSIPQGAATTITVALDPDIVAGAYYSDCQPVANDDKYLSPFVHDRSTGELLYRTSLALIQPHQRAITRKEIESFIKETKSIDITMVKNTLVCRDDSSKSSTVTSVPDK